MEEKDLIAKVDSIIAQGGDDEGAHSSEDELHLLVIKQFCPEWVVKQIERLSNADFSAGAPKKKGGKEGTWGMKTRVKITNSNVHCAKCGTFLGMTCDPFAPSFHESCYPAPHEKRNNE